jgi:hypothetical protein
LRVTIAGQPFTHLFFEFILSHSGWRWAGPAAAPGTAQAG